MICLILKVLKHLAKIAWDLLKIAGEILVITALFGIILFVLVGIPYFFFITLLAAAL